MNRLKLHLEILLLIFVAAGCASGPPAYYETKSERPTPVEAKAASKTQPIPKDNLVVLNHKYYEVHYQPEWRMAKYVRYTLTAAQLREKKANRKKSGRFIPDPQLETMQLSAVTEKECAKGSGYDKGHLAPAEDFRYDQEAMNSTFVLSNVVPQKAGLNRGIWKKLENRVRRWACGEEKITVFTGPLLDKPVSKLTTGLAVPEEFFKIVVDETPPRKSIAFVFKQEDRGGDLDGYIVAVEEVERRIHEDLVPDMRDLRAPTQLNPWIEKDCR